MYIYMLAPAVGEGIMSIARRGCGEGRGIRHVWVWVGEGISVEVVIDSLVCAESWWLISCA